MANTKAFTPPSAEIWQESAPKPVLGQIDLHAEQKQEKYVEEKQHAPVASSTPVPQPSPQQADNFISQGPIQPITSSAPIESAIDKENTHAPGAKGAQISVPKPVSHTRKEADAEKRLAQQQTPDAMDSLVEVVEAAHNVMGGNPGAVLTTSKDLSNEEEKAPAPTSILSPEPQQGNTVSIPVPRPAPELKQENIEALSPNAPAPELKQENTLPSPAPTPFPELQQEDTASLPTNTSLPELKPEPPYHYVRHEINTHQYLEARNKAHAANNEPKRPELEEQEAKKPSL